MNLAKNTVIWRNTANNSLEYFTLHSNTHGYVLEGTVVILLEQLPAKVTYRIECDCYWRTKQVDVLQKRAKKTTQLTLTVDANLCWCENGTPLSFATGLFDVDFEITPATNTLPIRRLNLNVGESRVLDSVWVRFPSLKAERLQQRYTRVDDKCYKYEATNLGFKANLQVDDNGLIVKYGDLWVRIA